MTSGAEAFDLHAAFDIVLLASLTSCDPPQTSNASFAEDDVLEHTRTLLDDLHQFSYGDRMRVYPNLEILTLN